MADKRKLFFVFLLVIFLFQTSTVLALELKYPTLPGAIPPQEIEQKLPEERLPLYVNYFLRLFYLVTIIAVVTVIIFGGLLWLVSGAKPLTKVTAKNWITRGLTGLLILVTSYLVLAAINPQLLVFRVAPSAPPVSLPYPFAYDQNRLAFLQVPLGTMLQTAIEELDQTTTTEKWGKVKKVEVPLLEIKDLMASTTVIIQQAMEALERCKCGESKYNLDWSGLVGMCVPGEEMEPGEEPPEDPQQACLSRCEDCGTRVEGGQLACDIRDVRRREIKDEEGKTIEVKIEILDGGEWRDIDIAGNDKYAIKYYRMRLQELLAELQKQRIKLSPEQLILIEKSLAGNTGNLLMSQLLGVAFQEDFSWQKEGLKEQGFDVDLEKPKQFPGPQSVVMSPPAVDPLTFYAPLKGRLIPPSVKRENQRVYRESQRASFFAVLTSLTLEDIEGMLKMCLSLAFGQDDFLWNPEDKAEISDKTLREGIIGFVNSVFLDNDSQFTKDLTDEMEKKIDEKVSSPASIEERIARCRQDCGGDNECLGKCDQETIPPNYLSKKLTEVLTTNLREFLPEEIRNTLTSKVRERILSSEFNDILTTKVGILLDQEVLQGALSKTLGENLPFIAEALERRITDFLPELVLEPLQTVDRFLTEHIKDFREKIDQEIEDLVQELAEQLTASAIDLIEKFKLGHPQLFREFLSFEQCQDYIKQGYYYTTLSPTQQGKCTKATPQQINSDVVWGNIIYPQVRGVTNEVRLGDRDVFCRWAKYDWDEKNQRCLENQWVDLKGLKPTDENFKRWGKMFLAGLLNFAEQFLVALIDTAVYTMTRYAQVWVEDTIIAPLQPYLSQLTGFQENLHKVIASSTGEILPQEISTALQRTIFENIKALCRERGKGSTACEINKELNKEVMDYLSDDIQDFLESKVEDYIPDNIRNNYLDKPFAEILWEDVAKVKEVIQGTPKQIICGELEISGPLKSKCDLTKSDQLGGLFPHPDLPAKAAQWDALSGAEKGQCFIIWYACENPVIGWDQFLSDFIKNFLTKKCQELKQSCQEGNCDLCQNDTDKFACRSCDAVVENSIAYSTFFYGMELSYGKVPPPPAPDPRTPNTKKEEIEAYQWLAVTFPDLISDIDKLAKERRLWNEWSGGSPSKRQEAINADRPEGLPGYNQYFARAFVAWFTKQNTVKQVLTAPPLGVMSYFRGEYYRGSNFLGQTGYQLLENGVCYKVANDIRKQKSLGLPVSEEDIALSRACQSLTQGTARALGLGEKLINYVRPKEYQILFGLIKNELTPYERPDVLNDLLFYLYQATPVSMLYALSEPDSPLSDLALFLGAPTKNYINRPPLNEEVIVLIFRKLGKEDWLNQRLGWEKWRELQKTLAKTPIQIIGEHLREKIIPRELLPDLILMDALAESTVLGQPYIDTLGRALHLDKPVRNIFIKKAELDDKINQAVIVTQGVIRDAFDKVLLEYPTQLVKWAARTVGKILGLELGGKTGDQMVGACRSASEEETRQEQCPEGEVYKVSSQECCSLGKALVCLQQKRGRTAGEQCKAVEGEIESDDGSQCVFDNQCSRCREATYKEKKEEECYRHEDERFEKREQVIRNEKDEVVKTKELELCCRERTKKEVGGDTLCCVDIMRCVADEFTDQLEVIGDILLQGPPLNDLAPK